MAEGPLTYARIAGLRAAAGATPAGADALCALGTALWFAGQREEALTRLRQAVQADPGDPVARRHLGNALAESRRPEEAEEHYRALLQRDPSDPNPHFGIGCAWMAVGDPERAEAGFRAALALRPDHAAALNNLGSALREQRRTTEALECYRQAAALQPELQGLHGNLGSALLALGRAEDALPPLRQAVRLTPDDPHACNNLGGALLALDQPREAEGWFRHAVRLQPGLHQARFGLALALLAQGKFRDGWAEYECRWSDPEFTADEPEFAIPRWRGEVPLQGRSLLLHAEQGLGDTLQFVRYAPLLRARGARVVLQVQAPLVELVGLLADAAVARDAPPPVCDLHCPLLSVPLALGTELATIPAEIPYLHAPPEHLARWAGRLGDKRRPRIGIAFAGDPSHPEDAQRSLSATRFLSAFIGLEAELHLLQKGVCPEDRAALAGIEVHDAEISDFRDTAALIALMDLVVSVDTAPAHLAGAMGAPVWILLQFGADFRWLRGRDDSPWYPTARLFRQRRHADWSDALMMLNAALRERFAP